MAIEITYAELSKYPFERREAVLQHWLIQFAWDLLGEPEEVN